MKFPPPELPSLTILNAPPAFGSGSGSAILTFSTNRAWSVAAESVEGAGEWFTAEPLAGKAGENISVAVTVEPNGEYVPRSGTLVLRTEPNEAGTVIEERIAVEQRKKNVILLGDNRREVGSEKQILTVKVQSNVEYTVAIAEGGDWIGELPESRAAEGLEEKVHRFDIAANPDAQERTGVIVFTATDSELSDELTVVQAGWADPDPERTALRAIYDAAGGSGWTHNDNWCSDKPLGEWYGVETNVLGQVTSLRLPKNNLTGTISEKIALLSHLQHIDLSWNALEGELSPESGKDNLRLSELPDLETLNISHNLFTGSTAIDWYKLTQLRKIDLSSNRLEGYAIPIQWAPMFENGRMVDLILNDNYMYGDIPIGIQNHPEWDRMALQMIRQRLKEGSLNEMRHEKDIHLPDFTFTDLRDGSQRAIREVYSANKLTMLLAWDPTQEDSKTFSETIVRRFYTLFREQGFGVVAILPEGEAFRQAAEQYLSTHDVPWPVVSEYADAAGERLILPSWPYPSYLLLDQTGKVTHDMFDGQQCDYVAGEPRTMDMLSFRQSDWLGGLFSQALGKSKYQSTDFSKDKQYETLQKATRGKGIDIVLVGEAFTDIDIETGFYRQVMEYAMESFFALEPTKSYREYFNIYMVYAVSRDTHIGKFGSGGNTALKVLLANTREWFDVYNSAYHIIPEYYKVFLQNNRVPSSVGVIINGTNGGVTFMQNMGPNCVFAGYYHGYRPSFRETFVHESGHGFGLLGDEYVDYTGGWTPGEIPESRKKQLRSEQADGWYLNVSLTDAPTQVSWSHLLGHPNYSYVGIHEGGYYYPKGVWRSEVNSAMRDNDMYFNAFCRELIVKRILELSGEGYTFEKFLAKDSDEGRPSYGAASAFHRRAPEYNEHQPPINGDYERTTH